MLLATVPVLPSRRCGRAGGRRRVASAAAAAGSAAASPAHRRRRARSGSARSAAPLEDHVVLVQLVVDRRDLALAERVVQRGVDRGGRQAEARCAVAGRRRRRSRRRCRPGRCRRRSARRPAASSLGQARRPDAAGRRGCRSSACTDRWSCRAAADAHVLHRVEEDRQAGDARELRPQPRDHRLAALSLRCDGGLRLTNMKPPPGASRR